MIYILGFFFLFLLLATLWFFLFPVRFVRVSERSPEVLEPPEAFVYSYVLHIHTQFSYDSLGKPEDIIRVRDKLGIDYVIVTDHDDDSIKNFADERVIAGREVKLNDEEGNLLGDLLEVGSLRIIAHHFRGKYRWKLDKRRDYLFELIDLRDALLENKGKLVAYILLGLFLYPFLGRRILPNYTKLIDTELYARRYISEGWSSKVVGGLDHHVKMYVREVRKRFMVPDYELSFSLMRNFLVTSKRVNSKEKFVEAISSSTNVISFSSKPSFAWVEGENIKVYTPFSNTYTLLLSKEGRVREALGSNALYKNLDRGNYLVLGYTYSFRIGGLIFGVRPLFVSDLLEV